MSDPLNSVTEDLAKQIAAFMMREIRENPAFDTPWLDEVGAALYLGLKTRGMQNHRRQRTGPRYHKAGVVRYHRDDLDAFLRAGAVEPGTAS